MVEGGAKNSLSLSLSISLSLSLSLSLNLILFLLNVGVDAALGDGLPEVNLINYISPDRHT